MIVGDLMNEKFPTISSSENALETGLIMEEQKIGTYIVEDDGVFQGVLSKETFVSNIYSHLDKPFSKLKVKDLMDETVNTTQVSDDIGKVVSLLVYQKNYIKILPVFENGKVIGIVSKEDFTRLFIKEISNKFKVADLMCYSPLTAYDHTPVNKVVEDMLNYSAKRLLILAGDSLVGLISIHDIGIHMFQNCISHDNCTNKTTLTARDIMTHDPVTIEPSKDAAEAAKIMLSEGFGGIPVCKDGLEGIISRTDLLKGFELQYGLM